MYFSCHNHTEYSNLRLSDCNIKIGKLIEKALELGLRGIAITDHECLSGHIIAIQLAKKIREKNPSFCVGLGNEIYLVDSLEEVRDNYVSGITKFPHFILIAKNIRGYEALKKLSSNAWGNLFRTGKMERVVTETSYLSQIIQEYKGDLIASTACLGSYLGIKFNEYRKNPNQEIIKQINNYIEACKYLFGEDFYLEIQPSVIKENEDNEQREYNKFILNLAKHYNIKTIYTTDTHYLTKEHRPIHKSFLQSKDGDREVDDFYGTTYLMTKEEVWKYFKSYISVEDFEEMTNNTLEIANKIEFFDLYQTTVVPQIKVPPFNDQHEMNEYIKDYEYINKFYNSDYLIDRYLLFKLNVGMKQKYQPYNQINLERINIELKELWLISEKLNRRLASYYLLVQDLIDIMWTISLVGIARGSTTGFYCSYLLGISQMNPIKFNLPHWRHITAERPELPDYII